VIPWLIFGLVVVPLLVVAFVVARRKTVAGRRPEREHVQAGALTEQELADAEAYEAKWREQDSARYHEERIP
jgi:hypothetical protein